ncbi:MULTISPECIES: 60S ribosomal export protein NMD3 [unclassified Archaeoglobus]|uniref:60S ribosomal export protein NMD3 n=1 Tax=unclassified Archaeoglobus TaxID=2643606 RepID=UPI0025BAA8EB|nr:MULTISPECIES: NMD3-related protein [unclassified Archaeoglobus]
MFLRLIYVKCIVCGREIKQGHLCGKCIAEREKVVRIDKFEIVVCSRCGSIKHGNKWVSKDFREVFEDTMLKNSFVSEEFEVKDVLLDLNSNLVTFVGKIAGDEVSVTEQLNFSIKKLSCPRCSKESGGYYESIVQIRAENRELDESEIQVAMEILREILEREEGNEKAFVSKIERKREGVNIYLGSRNVGMKLSKFVSRRLGGSITESKKLHTKIDGRDVYRFTYSVKIPEYREGDVIEKDGRMYLVKNVQNGKGVDIITGKTVNIGRDKVAVKKEELQGGVVVNVDETMAEVVCNDGKVVVTAKPFGVEIGSEVRVFEHKGKHYSFLKDL